MRRLSWFSWTVRLGGVVGFATLHLAQLEARRRQLGLPANGEGWLEHRQALADSVERAQDGVTLLLVVDLTLGLVELLRLPWAIDHAAHGATSGCLFDVLATVFLIVYAIGAFMSHALGTT